MKNNRVLLLVLMLLASVGLIAPTTASADSVDPPPTTTVVLHKLQVDVSSGAVPVANDGRVKTLAQLSAELGVDVEPLPGVTFKYWAITDPTASLATLNPMTDAELDTAFATRVVLAPTGADGSVSAGALPSYDGLGNDARYYFREVSTPSNVYSSLASPFILGLPLINTAGDAYLEEVHLYPKNVTVYGAVDLTKVAGYGDLLPNAQFRLYQGTPASPFNPANPGTEYGPGLLYVTDATGHLTVSGLPYGDYYFVETQAPAGFMLDPAPVPFTITVSEQTRIEQVTKTNWITPTITKSASVAGQTADSVGYNEELTWVLQPQIPGNITSYVSYVVEDVLDPKLTYTDNLVVKVGGATLALGTHYTVTEPVGTSGGTLQITFVPDQLGSFARLDLINNTMITFTTKVNDEAVMGQAIVNNAKVYYNDGIAGPGTATSGAANVFTGGKVFKKVAETEDGTALPGASFKVAYDSAGTQYVKDAQGQDLVITSGDNGRFWVKGLAYDLVDGTTYYLVEIVAPVVGGTPYNLLQSAVPFTVNATSFYTNPSAITDPDTPPNAVEDLIINKTGFQIPQTGGMGTTVFTLIGLLLMGGAALVLAKRRRTNG